jgi:ribosomal protein S18 acetylase RimI-like enzyme
MLHLVLREASPDEASTIAALVRAAFAEYRGCLDPPSGALEETAEQVRQNLAVARVVLALERSQAIGCVFYERQNDALYFFRLAVLPAHRRRGVGRALIDYLESQARALDLWRVRLGVRLALVQLRAYYERRGYHFVEYGTHGGYSQPTYVILEKLLSSVPSVEGD